MPVTASAHREKIRRWRFPYNFGRERFRRPAGNLPKRETNWYTVTLEMEPGSRNLQTPRLVSNDRANFCKKHYPRYYDSGGVLSEFPTSHARPHPSAELSGGGGSAALFRLISALIRYILKGGREGWAAVGALDSHHSL